MINSIVAVEKNQGIGFNGFMPWPHLKHDMSWFHRCTIGNVVIMGSTTWKSLPKKLSDRINIVITSHNSPLADHVFSNPISAIEFSSLEYPDKEIFIIGGQALYDSTMSLVDKFFITEIDESYPCDKFFNLDYVQKHCSTVVEKIKYNEPVPYSIKEYTK